MNRRDCETLTKLIVKSFLIGTLKLNFRFAVRFGSVDLTKDRDCDDCPLAVEHEIEKSIIHKQYPSRDGHDIALIKLKTPVSLTENVRTICLPLKKDNLLTTNVHNNFTVMGFGRTETGKRSSKLLKTDVPFVNKERCEAYYKNFKIQSIADGEICAGGVGIDSCRGKVLNNQNKF